jgi:hypothetical protein
MQLLLKPLERGLQLKAEVVEPCILLCPQLCGCHVLLLLQLMREAPQPLLVLLLQGVVLGMHVSLQMLLPCEPLLLQLLPAVPQCRTPEVLVSTRIPCGACWQFGFRSCHVTERRRTLPVQTYLKRKRSSWSAAATAARQSPAVTASAASAFSTAPISVLRTVCVAAGAGEICGVPASTLAVPLAKWGLSLTAAAPCRHRAMSRHS